MQTTEIGLRINPTRSDPRHLYSSGMAAFSGDGGGRVDLSLKPAKPDIAPDVNHVDGHVDSSARGIERTLNGF